MTGAGGTVIKNYDSLKINFNIYEKKRQKQEKL